MKHIFFLLLLFVAAHVSAQDVQQKFYPNGRLESTRMKEDGTERFITYYESGRVKAMGSFRQGRRDGVWQEFAENGAVVAEARFAEGHRTGVWLFRDGSNALKGRLSYSDGHLVRGEQVGDGGELIAQRSY